MPLRELLIAHPLTRSPDSEGAREGIEEEGVEHLARDPELWVDPEGLIDYWSLSLLYAHFCSIHFGHSGSSVCFVMIIWLYEYWIMLLSNFFPLVLATLYGTDERPIEVFHD
jgi:hypothetical protein